MDPQTMDIDSPDMNERDSPEMEARYREQMRRFAVEFEKFAYIVVNNSNLSGLSNNATNGTIIVYSFPALIVVCSILGLIIVSTIVGNVFVISAILLEKSLRATSNYLILSLAVTDLMVAVLVMPICIVDELHSEWILGDAICDMWVSFDILCCTASILHLVAIALDRYWSVTNVDYTRKRSPMKILVMIILVWLVSFSVSVPPLLGWRQPSNSSQNSSECVISQDWGYTIYSTVGAFYIPLSLILALNYKIYIVARRRFQTILEKRGVLRAALQAQRASVTMLVGGPESAASPGGLDIATFRSEGSTLKPIRENMSNPNLLDPKVCLGPVSRKPSRIQNDPISGYVMEAEPSMIHSDAPSSFPSSLRPPTTTHRSSTTTTTTGTGTTTDTDVTDAAFNRGYTLIPGVAADKRKTGKTRRLVMPEIKKEKKTASVLGIITGAFILCWLPFFIVALVNPFCTSCHLPRTLMSVILWLGYCNSVINPIIYTIFNPNFRVAFRKLYCTRKKKIKLPRSSKNV